MLRSLQNSLLSLMCVWALSDGLHQSWAWSQDIRLAQQSGPYYVDEPMIIQIEVSGVEANQDVDCRLADSQLPNGLRVEGPQVGQSKSSFTQIINGRITSRESVSFKYNFQVTADRPGPVSVGPFVVEIDSKPQTLQAVEVEFEALQEDPQMELELSLPRDRIYVGEQVPLTIRWMFAGERQALQHAFANLQLRSPVFEQLTFLDTEPQSRTTLSIVTAAGVVEVDAKATQEQRGGENYVVLTGQRTFSAESPGEYFDLPASCRTQRVTRWARDMFGGLRPREALPALARAEPLSFRVLPIPRDNRPASYAGAVGSGFSLEVSANRSVVSVGDPIVLDIKLSGDGDLQRCALPPLEQWLGSEQFQLPAELPVGEVVGNIKQFKVNVRVKDAAVSQLPACEYAWFDPRQEKFATTQSKPIALQVNAAQIVSAADVVSAPAAAATVSAGQAPPSSTNANGGGGLASTINFQAANLAIQDHVPSLVVSPLELGAQSWMVTSLYALGIGLLVVGLIVQRWRQRIPRESPLANASKQARGQIRAVASAPLKPAAETIANAVRQLIAAWPHGDRTAVEAVIAECERLSYAPDLTDDAELKSALIARGLQAVDQYSRN